MACSRETFTFTLLLLLLLFEPNRHFTLKIDSDVRDPTVRDSFIGRNYSGQLKLYGTAVEQKG
jgi:hypothetical protein